MKIIKQTPRVVQDKKNQDMWRVQWPDKTVSVSTPNPGKKDGHYGFYNKTRAMEHIKRGDIENLILGLTYDAPLARSKAR